MNKVLVCENLSKSFIQENAAKLEIFHNLNFSVTSGETLSIVGSSGSGKTSLLQIAAGLDIPTTGKITVCDNNLSSLNQTQLCQLRNQHLGFIYQFHHLLPEFNALENTLMPLIIAGIRTNEKIDYAKYLLSRLGLAKRLKHFPSQLSGGERQRVAIARAVINNPQIIFADEPTGNLDNASAHQVFDLFLELQQEIKTSLLMVTHDPELAAKTQSRYRLHNGELSSQL